MKHPLLDATIHDFKFSWKELVLTDITFKIIALIILTPLVGILFEVMLAASGKTAIADQDILFFLLGPIGIICMIIVGGLSLGIVALEQSALMSILCAASDEKRLSVLHALRFSARFAKPVILITSRLIIYTLLTVLPFLAVIGLLYFTLLGEYDINFYLNEKPPKFLIAAGLGGIVAVGMIAVLLRLITGWFFALPIVLFEGLSPADTIKVSQERANGHRKTLLFWIATWFLFTVIASTLASSIVVFVAKLLVPNTTGTLWQLATAIGITLLIWSSLNLILNLLSTTTFTTILFNLYRKLGSEKPIDSSKLELWDSGKYGISLKVTKKRLLVFGVIGILIAVLVGVSAMTSVPLEDTVEIMAHRGASAAAPENTMASIKQAIEDDADWVEIDVQEIADGQVVVMHDSDFMKLAGVNLKIWDAKMSDLKEIDIGSRFDPKFKNERVPTLDQVLKVCKGKIGVNIELKYYGYDEQLEQRVIDLVEANGMESNVVLMSLKNEAVEKMKSLRPEWKSGLLMSVSAGNLKKFNADFFAVNASFASRHFIRSVHALGKEVYVWTVNDATSMSVMISRGADSLITDKPALARSVIKQRAELNIPERIILELAGTLGVTPEIGEQ